MDNNISAALHSEWIKSPVTNEFIRKLKDHRENIIRNLKLSSLDSKIEDKYIRCLSSNLNQIDVVIKLAQDTETFINTK